MEEEAMEICNAVCESFRSTSCNWSNWNNPLDHQFPDGTMQTCVGAQVRCGCTLTMRLVSYVTYEHPTAVVVTFLFILAVALIMLIRCCLTEHSSTITDKHQRRSSFTTPETIYHISCANETGRETNFLHTTVEICNMEKENPPPYSYAITQEVNGLPPSYIECMQRKN